MFNEKAYINYLKTRKSLDKTNYHLVCEKEIEKIRNAFPKEKPRLLLHVCCAVCACWPLAYLADVFALTVYFNNSNIYPQTEYDRRLSELKRYIREASINTDVIVTPYDNENYTRRLAPMKDDPEGFGRCFYCYAVRMSEAYQYAEDHGYDYFSTVMSMSRQKDARKINGIGRSLARLHPSVSYLYADFKKGGGQEKQKELVDAYDLYRQDYCGCVYSYQKRKNKDD